MIGFPDRQGTLPIVGSYDWNVNKTPAFLRSEGEIIMQYSKLFKYSDVFVEWQEVLVLARQCQCQMERPPMAITRKRYNLFQPCFHAVFLTFISPKDAGHRRRPYRTLTQRQNSVATVAFAATLQWRLVATLQLPSWYKRRADSPVCRQRCNAAAAIIGPGTGASYTRLYWFVLSFQYVHNIDSIQKGCIQYFDDVLTFIRLY